MHVRGVDAVIRMKNVTTMLALAAILLRAVLPAGWMPAPAGTHAVLVICTINGAKRITLPDAPLRHQHDRRAGPCAFAAAPVLASMAMPAAIAPAQACMKLRFDAIRESAREEKSQRAPGARAPPLDA